MTNITKSLLQILTLLILAGEGAVFVVPTNAQFQLNPNEHVCYIGNTLADRMQHVGWLETYLHDLHPNHDLTFRNLGYAADEVKTRPRAENFGDPNQWLTQCSADVVFCFFGYCEALRGPAGLAQFEVELAQLIDEMQTQQYNGQSPPRLVFCSPIAHENLKTPNLPDGTANNLNLAMYSAAMQKICQSKQVPFVDLFGATQRLYAEQEQPLTINGIHLNDEGDRLVSREIISQLFPAATVSADDRLARLRESVLDKNFHWFSRYRVIDEYNVFGGRSQLEWFGQSNGDVMMREMEIFDVLTANRDQRIWAVAKGKDFKVSDNNLPPELVVKPNKEGPLADGAFPYLDPVEAISKMTLHQGLEANLFASEKEFPRLVNPVQMAVDTDSRLWVSVWESYPHWNPTKPRKDAILILPDEDGDGRADECLVFADGLNSVTGFEFWGGGILVAALPEIWFLKDTDGDDRADVKIRMLQGVSSADTHHSANAFLIGPDGWLHFSRGIFNVANFETPTKTYRSGQSGVHRFNPRTFEVDFHFPIGPNPHGDSFDRWGYQFVNDGTGGTGSNVNIGKGVPNKEWFQQRMRPVPCNGFLSSSHFPPELDGNFLIANVIGFLGVMQLKTEYHGADIKGTEIDPIISSEDPNFRPSDLEIGGDGALYVSDWHNALIGHMQHNMRDPNRDNRHGRVYRITASGRDLVQPVKMKNKPIAEVCQNFFARENNTRYHARLELSGRPTNEVVEQVGQFADSLNPQSAEPWRDESQALLECLWVFEEHRVPRLDLLNKVFKASEPRVRAAAIRTLGHWSGGIDGWEALLMQAAQDESALVRAEAVKAAVDLATLNHFQTTSPIFQQSRRGLSGDNVSSRRQTDATENPATTAAFLEVASRPLDPELEYVLKYAGGKLQIEKSLEQMLSSTVAPSPAATKYIVANGSVTDLLRLQPTAEIQRTILVHPEASLAQMQSALDVLAATAKIRPAQLLIDLIGNPADLATRNLSNFGKLLVAQPASELQQVQSKLEALAIDGASPAIKQIGFAAWIGAAGSGDPFIAATQSADRLRDFLAAVPQVTEGARGALFSKVQPLMFELPTNVQLESGRSNRSTGNGVAVEYYSPHSKSAEMETMQTREPTEKATQGQFDRFVPAGKSRDSFSNVFHSLIQIPKTGDYTFFTSSDDGSNLYIDEKLVVNNDGNHGDVEAAGSVTLNAGLHAISVVYFNSSGGNSLHVSWQSNDFPKQIIPADRLFLEGNETLQDAAISALISIPGYANEKFNSLTQVIAAGKNRSSAITALSQLPTSSWNQAEIKPLVNNLIGYLSELPARDRTSGSAVDAMTLARSITTSLMPAEAEDLEKRLARLDVRVIAIGTVPHRMIFDKELIAIEAGQSVEFRFSNTDSMPHNFAITIPGSLAEIGELAESTSNSADAIARNYIPDSTKILLGSRLLQPSEGQALSFTAPLEPGIYPYVCTYPGHWRRMYGALYVVKDYQQYSTDPEKYLAEFPMKIKDELLASNTRGQEWKFDELVGDVNSMRARSFEVGQAAFKAANCIACHRFNNEGIVFGPDLALLDEAKRMPANLLRSIIEPSKDIEEKFSSTMFLLLDGKTISGMILEENANEVKIVVDPLAKDSATLLAVDDIDGRKKSALSPMPLGMVDKLSREEIIDLIAYLYSKGNPQDKVFEGHLHPGH